MDKALVLSAPMPKADALVQDRIQACMQEAGFDYSVDTTETVSGVNPMGLINLNDDPDQAAEVGYATSIRDDTAPAEQEVEDNGQAYNLAYVGNEADSEQYTLESGTTVTAFNQGCVGDSLRSVYGSAENFLAVSQFTNETVAARGDDIGAPLQSALAEYVSCVNEAGYAVDGMSSMEALAAERFAGSRSASEPPTAEESDMRRADATCQRDSDLRSALLEQFKKNATPWVSSHHEMIDRAWTAHQTTKSNLKEE